MALTPPYAAPEVVAAYQQHQRQVPASAAVDIWAVGVMAYELLTRTVWFDGLSQEEMLSKVATQGQLPWEVPGAETRRTLRRTLRALAPHILSCLHRDPAQRPTAAQLAGKLDSLYSTTKSQTSTCRTQVRSLPPAAVTRQLRRARVQCSAWPRQCAVWVCGVHLPLSVRSMCLCLSVCV